VARTQSIQIRETLNRLVPPQRLGRLAREHGAVIRHRRIGAVPFFWTLVLGFAADRTRTLAGFRRAFEVATGRTVVPSAFYDRFTPGLVRMLRAVIGEVVEKLGDGNACLRGTLSGFKDVLMSDSTLIRLHRMLARAFPACRTNHTQAAAKAHIILSVAGAGATSVKLTSERVHDGPVLRAGKWVRDRLLLFDLGYYRFQLFACIDREGGYFITRLKDRANPLILAVHQNLRGRKVPLAGNRLKWVLSRLKRRVLDVEVELGYRKRSYGGKRSGASYRCRLVGVFNEQTRQYHLYLTNIPPDRLGPDDIARTYGARWLIELLFRELKCRYRIDQVPSRRRCIVEALLLAAVITTLVSQSLLRVLHNRLPHYRGRLHRERWAAVFAAYSTEILAVVIRPPAEAALSARYLSAAILREAIDPNRTRLLLLERVSGQTCAA
jgi:putative transposase